MATKLERVRADLVHCWGYFPLDCLEHLRSNRHRLIRGSYSRRGHGCMFYLLSERLPAELRIDSKQALTQFFTGQSGYPACELPEYQPARWLVRLIDRQICAHVQARYGDDPVLEWETVLAFLDEYIAERESIEADSRRRNRTSVPAGVPVTSGAAC